MTYYWVSAALLLLGVLLLALVASRVFRAVRAWNKVRGQVQLVVGYDVGLLQARKAALDVALRERRGGEV